MWRGLPGSVWSACVKRVIDRLNSSALSQAKSHRDAVPAERRLRITEIFYSIQGEADSVGWPTVFVRLTGCPLRCQYCDTAYAFHGGEWLSLDEIEHKVARYTPQHVTVTGGEPLAQRNCTELLKIGRAHV